MFCQGCGAAVADGSAFCGTCGRPIAGVSVSPPLPVSEAGTIIPPISPVAVVGVVARSMPYAGFWLRVAAALIDGIILAIPLVFVWILMFASAMPFFIHAREGGNPALVLMAILPRVILILFLFLLLSWLYWAAMESSSWQATLGKRAVGVYVTDLAGNRVTFGRASGRFFAGRGIGAIPSIGGLYFLVSCIMAGLTERKQALHDMIASCLVMRKA
jgi:uncharacterized RDD family membrane protein YckC